MKTVLAVLAAAIALNAAAGGSSVLYRNRVRVCNAVLMADGAYTAGHCLERASELVVGRSVARAWSTDPVRDLGHIVVPGRPQPLRSPAVGEIGNWMPSPGPGGEFTYIAPVGVVNEGRSYLLTSVATGEFTGQLWCRETGRRTMAGDSGSGIWGKDGALLGIIIGAQGVAPDGREFIDPWCGSARQLVLGVGVP